MTLKPGDLVQFKDPQLYIEGRLFVISTTRGMDENGLGMVSLLNTDLNGDTHETYYTSILKRILIRGQKIRARQKKLKQRLLTMKDGQTIELNNIYAYQYTVGHLEYQYGGNHLKPGWKGQLVYLSRIDLDCLWWRVKMDGLNDAFDIDSRYLKVVDEDSEEAWIKKAQEIAKAFKPNHEHKYHFKWNGLCGRCECGVSIWRAKCWTAGSYRFMPPRQLVLDRPDLFQHTLPRELPKGTTFRERSLGLIPEEILRVPIQLIGVGSIGSFTALAIHKMGFMKLGFIDPDRVAIENVGTQLYTHAQIGEYKTNALNQCLNQYRAQDTELPDIQTCPERYLSWDHPGDQRVVIISVDSMQARREIWDIQKNKNRSYPGRIAWVIDARMGAEEGLLYIMNPSDPKDVESYERTLYSDEVALNEPCTRRGTVYMAMLMASLISQGVKDILTQNPRYARITALNMREHAQVVHYKNSSDLQWP